jgi:TRAP transporter TAXI family solute receptor
MLKRRTICVAMATAFLAAGLAIPGGPARAQESIRIGSSSIGSDFYTIAVGAGDLIHKYAKMSASVESVGGSTASINALGAGKIEFALSNAFAATAGYTATHMFKGRPINVRLVLQGQPTFRILVARKGSGIKTPKDLEGKIVIAKRRALPELALTMNALAKVFGIDMSKVKVVETTNTGEALTALRAGTVDAAILPGGLKAPQFEEPLRNGVFEFVYISKKGRDAALKLLPKAIHGKTVPAGAFTNQKQDLYTFELSSYFVARGDIPDDVVYKVTKAILDHHKEFMSYHSAAASWTAQASLENPAIPFHAGAVRYYKEKGLWTGELEALQKSLLKKK